MSSALSADIAAVGAALIASDIAGVGTAPNRAGLDVGVDIVSLCDSAQKMERDLYRLCKEIDRVMPDSGSGNTAIALVLSAHFSAG